jgi:redox-sensitive bicupin YhaK (pirin superfamily)
MTELQPGPVEMTIVGRARDLGGFEVRRVLPFVQRRMVGPFIFLDQMGPALFTDGRGIDVRPHPHIGLATVTYLFDGELMHRDSLGTEREILPGDVNWMNAGSGITHSERSSLTARTDGVRMFGLQSWVALPQRYEESAPAFAHIGKADLPVVEGEGKSVRVIAGAIYGARSPVETFSDLFYADAVLEAGARLKVPAEPVERALYLVEGAIAIGDERYDAGRLLVLRPGAEILVDAITPARAMLLGGEPMDGPRLIWWNFVSSSAERLEQAKADWQAGRRFAPVPGDPERIPLPDQSA